MPLLFSHPCPVVLVSLGLWTSNLPSIASWVSQSSQTAIFLPSLRYNAIHQVLFVVVSNMDWSKLICNVFSLFLCLFRGTAPPASFGGRQELPPPPTARMATAKLSTSAWWGNITPVLPPNPSHVIKKHAMKWPCFVKLKVCFFDLWLWYWYCRLIWEPSWFLIIIIC